MKLAPASLRLDQKKATGSFGVCTFEHGVKSTDIYVLPQSTLPLNNEGELTKKPWANRFWMVQLGDDNKGCSMDLKLEQDKIGELHTRTPILVNRRLVKAGDVLKRKRLESDPQPSAKRQAA